MRRGIVAALLLLGCEEAEPAESEEASSAGTDAATSTAAATTEDASTPPGSSSATSSDPSTSGDPATSADPPTSTGGPPIDPGEAGSLVFAVNQRLGDDYADLLTLPPGFGSGEFTFEIWALPDNALRIGPTAGSSTVNWTEEDPVPYLEPDWWFAGNFLLDGHHNGGWEDGSFDLQLYGGGRVRWLFGDGELRGVQAAVTSEAESVLDGQWHRIATVRRADGAGATLELWVDGLLIATDDRPTMVDMTQYWDTWAGFGEPGWFLGAEKGRRVGGQLLG